MEKNLLQGLHEIPYVDSLFVGSFSEECVVIRTDKSHALCSINAYNRVPTAAHQSAAAHASTAVQRAAR